MKRFLGLLFALAQMVLILVGCDPRPKPAQDKASTVVPEKSGYIRRANNETVIVFVHGVFGGPRSTWTNDTTKAYWPELLSQDGTFANSDIYVFGYDTPYFSTSYSLDDLIENARLRFNNDEIFSKHKRVIFICHSMGGLVIRGLVKRYQDKAPQIPLIYFLSTPTAGAHIAKLASFFTKNPQLRAMVPADADNFVTTLQHDWRALSIHPLSKCAFEVHDTDGIRVVDEQSAGALCDGALDPVNEDHIGIAKPRDKDDTAYIAFRQAFLALNQQPAATVTYPLESVVGHVDTLRKVEVDCGEVKENVAEIQPPVDLNEGQKVVGVVASLQEASNLKHGEALAHGVKDQTASVYYRLEGLDRGPNGGCAGHGSGIIVTAFILRQPRLSPLPPGFQATSAVDQSLDILRKSGTLRIADWDHIPPITFGGDRSGCWPYPTSASWVLVDKSSKETGRFITMSNVKSAKKSSVACDPGPL
jgi:pimeloyl-ACP methyl ester carboxylesterase